MINVTVIKAKDIIKYLARIVIAVILLVILARYFYGLKETNAMVQIKDEDIDSLVSCLEETIPQAKQMNKKEEKKDKEETDFVKNVLTKELGMISALTKRDATVEKLSNEEINVTSQNNTTDNNKQVVQAETNLKTEVIQTNVPNKFTSTYNGVQIKNETKLEITDNMLNFDLSVNSNNIIILHAHTCESYTSSEKYSYEQTGNFRSTDLNYTVSRVGDELTNQLQSYGYNVIHDKTYHDYPIYSGSYERSLTTVQNLLKITPDTDVVFDIHRDAIGDSSYAPKVKIGDEYACQLMFVIGTNGSGLKHDNWIQNLKFAITVQEKANEMYPGLFKPIVVRDSRYNQHVSKCASIIEVGATGNTLDEANISMKYLSKVLSEVLK